VTAPEPEFKTLQESGPILRKLATAIHWDHVARLDQGGFLALHAAFKADTRRIYLRAWADAAKALRNLAGIEPNPIMRQALLQIAAGFDSMATNPPSLPEDDSDTPVD